MPVAPVQKKQIRVVVDANGTIQCVPHVTRIKPGGVIQWVGPPHSGVIRGRIPGPVRDNFTEAELTAIAPKLTTTGLPFNQMDWHVTAGAASQTRDTIQVKADAPNHTMYKYDVTVPGHPTLDPVIIVDENAT